MVKNTVKEIIVEQKDIDTTNIQNIASEKEHKDAVLTDAIWAEVNSFIEAFRRTYHKEWKSSIKAYTMDKTDRYIMLQQDWRWWDSNIYTPFVKNLVDKTFNRLYDTEIDFIVNAERKVDRRWEKHIKTLLQNWFSDINNRTQFFSCVKSQIITWNGFAKATIQTMWDDFKLKIENIPVFNLFFNVNMDFYNSWLPIIERSIKSLNQILDECAWLYVPTKQELDSVIFAPKAFSSHDDSRVWDMWVRHNDIMSSLSTKDSQYNEDNLYKIEKYNNNVAEVIWRYTDTHIVLYVNGYKWYDDVNPLGCHPYVNLMYDPSYWRNISRGIASTHLDWQYAINALNNKALDDVRLSSLNMWVIEWSWDVEWVEDWEKFFPTNWQVLRIPQWTKLRRFDEFKPMDANLYNSIGNIVATWENEVWLNSLTWWQQWWSKERSSFAAQTLVNTTQLNVKPAVEWMSLWLTKISQTWQKMLTKFIKDRWLDTKIELRTFDNQFVKLDTKYLTWNYTIVFSNKSLVSLNNMQRVLDKVNAINALTPLLKDYTTWRPLINQEVIVAEMMRELWYEDNAMLTQEDFNKKQLQEQIASIDLQIQLLDKQKELEQKKQEMSSELVNQWLVNNWQPQPSWLQSNSWQPIDLWGI